MFFCGITNINNLKNYFKNYMRMFDTVNSNFETNTDNIHDFSNEWENISTPRGQ